MLYTILMFNRRSTGKKITIAAVIAVLVAAIGYGAWVWLGPDKIPDEEDVTQQTDETTVEETSEVSNINTGDDTPTATSTETFTSNKPSLELEHPSIWSATTTEDDGVRVQSPQFVFETVDGQEIDGYFRIYIRQGARDQDSTYLGRGLASQPSEKLTYSDPPEGQRSETNLSFFGLDSTDNFAYFFLAGNFSLETGQSLGADYGQENSTFIISGGYSSPELEDDMAAHKVPLDYFDQTNAYRQAVDILKSLRLL